MKKFLFSTILCLFLAVPHASAYSNDDELSFEGKVSAQISRQVSVPFPIIVDKVIVGIGTAVQKDQRLLEYHLENHEERVLQKELLTAGGEADWKMQKSSLEQELLSTSSRRKVSSALAEKGLGSQEENASNARAHGLVRDRLAAVKEKEHAALTDFAYRLRELEKDLGHKLKARQQLPKVLYMTSPIAGTVTSMSPYARPMGLLTGVAFTVAVLDPIQVHFLVYESEINKLFIGQPVKVELARDKKVNFTGKIIMLSWQPTDTTIGVPSFYNVWIDVENADYLLKPGYKVIVHVQPRND